MDRKTRVSVFESDDTVEIQMMKGKLRDAGIECEAENGYLSFTTTPTATALKIMVDISDEQKAFKIIDAYLQNQSGS